MLEVSSSPRVSVIMGSNSDWATMRHAALILEEFKIPYERKVISAHRTPDLLFEYASQLESREIRVLIAGAGGAAHLPGMAASKTTVPVVGVPVSSRALNGIDSLLSIVQMPGGIPVATLAIGEAGAKNAGLFAVAILALTEPELRSSLRDYRARLTASVLASENLPL